MLHFSCARALSAPSFAIPIAFGISLVLGLALVACGDDNPGGNTNQNGNNNNVDQAWCGDGIQQGAEECDNGAANSDSVPDACRTDCTEARCGDDVVDTGETCDDGPQNSDVTPDACRDDCTPARCGDGVVDVLLGESCDPQGETLPTASCDAECHVLVAFCGNGAPDAGEECDDGNNQGGDGCGPTCQVESCGNGFVDVGEECDDGSALNSDLPNAACRSDCTLRGCGDDIVDDLEGEECDGDPPPGLLCTDLGFYRGTVGCTSTCRVDTDLCTGECGDGVADLADGEGCDGANLGGTTCLTHGYYGGTLTCQSNCQPALGLCTGRCGDGIADLANGEVCDGADFGGVSCADYHFYTGTLSCSTDCHTITPQCEQHCGDGVKNGLEECDGDDLDGALCITFPGFDAGRLSCNERCERVFTGCYEPGWTTRFGGVNNTLNAVWGSSATDVWIVGNWGTILHNTGGYGFTLMPSGTTEHLQAIWGSGPDDIFVVGDNGTILHYDGVSWQPMTSPTTLALKDVWGFSATDVFAVGETGTVLHYNGSTWTASTVPGVTSWLLGIWGSAPTDVYAVGGAGHATNNYYIAHYNGSSWTKLAYTPPNTMLTVWGSGPDDVWAGGLYDNSVHYNGTSWSSSTWFYGHIEKIWGLGPSEIYSVGRFGSIYKYNGSSWTRQQSNTSTYLTGIWGSSRKDIWAVGSSGKILHYSDRGPGWTVSLPPGNIRCSREGGGLWAASDNDAFAVGDGGMIFRFNGSSWSEMTSPTTVGFNGIMGLSSSSVYAVATGNGRVYRFNGTSWAQMPSQPSFNYWWDIWVNSDSEIYLAGDGHQVAYYNGTSWQNISPGTGGNGKGIWATAPNDIYFDNWGGLFHYNGTSWTMIAGAGPQVPNNTLVGGSSNDLWALGGETGIRHWNGTSMQQYPSGVSEIFNSIFRTRGGEYFAVGDNGGAAWFDGFAWSPMLTHTDLDFRAVHGASRGRIFAMGDRDSDTSTCTIFQFDGELPRLPCGADTGAEQSAVDPATGSCILAFSTPKSWVDAEAHCVTLGGHLATIESAGKNEIVASLRLGNDWIGLNDRTTEGSWQWTSGAAFGYPHWYPGEPSNSGGNEDCVQLWANDAWNDAVCTNANPFLCEIPTP